MVPRASKLFLIKILPVFVLTILVWQHLGISNYYHRAVATMLDVTLPPVEPSKLIDAVYYHRQNFVLRVALGGNKGNVDFTARNTTLNYAMLLALYLASPILPFWQMYLAFFFTSLLLLFLVHIGTVAAMFQLFLSTNPSIVGAYHYPPWYVDWVKTYTGFYELNGMYIFVLLMWVPYIVAYVWCAKNLAPGASHSMGTKGGLAKSAR